MMTIRNGKPCVECQNTSEVIWKGRIICMQCAHVKGRIYKKDASNDYDPEKYEEDNNVTG